jgi:phytoene/squalene synthetase
VRSGFLTKTTPTCSRKWLVGRLGQSKTNYLKLVREDRLSRGVVALDREILKSVNSGPPIRADRRYWGQVLALADAGPESR